MSAGMSVIEGSRVILRGLEEDDLGCLVKWGRDRELMLLTGETKPLTRAGAEAFFTRVKKDIHRVWFIILDKATKRPIGECGLLRMFLPWRTADLSMIIGEKEYWGKGHSHEAMDLLLNFTFKDLRLHRVSVGVLEFNARAIDFYKRFGFREEGRQREGYLLDGKYHDFVMMSLLEGEYRSGLKKGAPRS